MLLASWQLVVCLVGIWWGSLLLKQGRKIAELESRLGMSQADAQNAYARTERMLISEGSVFMLLLLGSTVMLSVIYYRDQRRSRQIQSFFASFTHELKTPLTSIRLQAESIAENPSDNKLVTRLLQDTARLESQVEKTLELARMEGGGSLATQSMQLRNWLDRQIRSTGELYADKVAFEVNVPDVVVEADPNALSLIFKNIVENAVRHTKKERVHIKVWSEQQGTNVHLKLKDDGVGFQGDTKLLGELFAKGKTSTGSGVGLYLIQKLMTHMNGSAKFASTVDSGFQIDLIFQEGSSNA